MAAALPTPSFGSSILKLPVGKRSRALQKLSANANAPGGGKRQINGTFQPNGRAQQAAARNLRNALGIYLIETRPGTSAFVGGATPATILTPTGTPTSTVVAANELDPVTYTAGTKSLTVTIGSAPATVLGEASIVV